jgi:peptide/nickel transport system substrate-binding protein
MGMGKRTVALLALAGLAAAGCSSSSSSQGVVSTSAAPTTAAPTVTTAPGTTAQGEVTTTATTAPKPAGPVNLVVGVDTDPPTLDPAGNVASFTAGSVLLAIDDLLMLPTEQGGEPKPLLLESLTEAPDRLSWRLKLRPDLKFQDGTPLDAAAVKFNLDRQKTSLYNGPSLGPVTSVDVVDPLTVDMKLSTPWVAVPAALSGVVGIMVSPAAVVAKGDQFGRDPVGIGPFKLKEWVPNDHITVVKDPNYWGPQKPQVDQIEFRFISEENARLAAMKAGDIDAMTGILRDNVDELSKDSRFQIDNPPTQGYGLSLVNATKPGLDDPRVRKALTMAVDYDALAKAFNGDGYAVLGAGSPFPRDNKWFLPPDTEPKFDPEGAKALLAEYGKPVSFTYKSLPTPQTVVDSVKATIDYWQKVGVDAKLEIVPDAVQYVTDVVLGNYDVAAWASPTGDEPDAVLYEYFHTGGARNYQKSSDPALDKALEAGRVSNDPAVRKQSYDDAQRLIRADTPVLMSSFGSIYVAGRSDLTGMKSIGFFPSRTVGVQG